MIKGVPGKLHGSHNTPFPLPEALEENPVILGLNLFHGDSACALIHRGKILAAVAEERLSRIKHAAGFPERAMQEVFRITGADPRDLEAIAVGRDPRAHRFRKLTYLLTHPFHLQAALNRKRVQRAMGTLPLRLAATLGVPITHLQRKPLVAVEHHLAHAASAFLPSPFEKAWILTLDGFGDFVSILAARGEGTRITPVFRIYYPQSPGILYQAVTQFIGFPHYGDEGKTMGLAPYGDPDALPLIPRFLQIHERYPYFSLHPPLFRHFSSGIPVDFLSEIPEVPPLYQHWEKLLGPPRSPGTPLTSREENLAAAVQKALELLVFTILKDLYKRWRCPNLCLAGGVALNSVMNGKIPLYTPFEHTYIFPAPADDGLAVGAALWAETTREGKRERPEPVTIPLFGPRFSEQECREAVRSHPELERIARIVPYEDERRLLEKASQALATGKIVGWFTGPMEFGPRALGCRSILADPRDPGMKDRLNRRIKRREPFRPFAPAILREAVPEWFSRDQVSPAMLHVIPFRAEKRALVPAVVHVDGTGRLQTVEQRDHPRFYALLKAFAQQTGIPLLLNTSFNENEPIVCAPEDALQCFLRTDMDILVLETLWIERI